MDVPVIKINNVVDQEEKFEETKHEHVDNSKTFTHS
jgi:hypothetical protein